MQSVSLGCSEKGLKILVIGQGPLKCKTKNTLQLFGTRGTKQGLLTSIDWRLENSLATMWSFQAKFQWHVEALKVDFSLSDQIPTVIF